MRERIVRRLLMVILAFGLVPMAIFAAGDIEESSDGRIVLYSDMVRGHTNPTMGPTCALSSQYLPGESIVWRIRLFDTASNSVLPKSTEELLAEAPDGDALAAMVEGVDVAVHLSDGQIFPAHFGAHSGAEPTDYFWTTMWEVSDEYPTGTLDYWVTVDVAESGMSARYDPFNVAISKLTIVEPE